MNSKTQDLVNDLEESIEKLTEHGQYWKHYKGGIYHVDGAVIDTDDGRVRVLYHRVAGPDYNPRLENMISFVRPLKEWFDTVAAGRQGHIRRFVPVLPTSKIIYEEIDG